MPIKNGKRCKPVHCAILLQHVVALLWKYSFYLTNMEFPYKAPQLKADDVYSQLIVELEDILKNGDFNENV